MMSPAVAKYILAIATLRTVEARLVVSALVQSTHSGEAMQSKRFSTIRRASSLQCPRNHSPLHR